MPSAGWDREWAFVQARAEAPRPGSLGCSTVSHDRMGFCATCTREDTDEGINGSGLELMAWRLLALREEAS